MNMANTSGSNVRGAVEDVTGGMQNFKEDL